MPRQQMTSEFREMVAQTLTRGEELPREWASRLFPPEKRECELMYHGKERDEDILAATMAVPLQPARVFGDDKGKWRNRIIFGDNLQVLRTLVAEKRAGSLCNADGSPGARVVYIDPPFASKRDFKGTQDQKAYQDRIAGAEFLEFLRKRLVFIRELLSDDGTLYIHLDQKKVYQVKQLADELFGESLFRNHVVWYYTNKIPDTRKGVFTVSTDHILTYGRSRRVVFNPQATKRDKPQKVSRFAKVDGKKVYLKDANGKTMYDMRTERVMDNVWQIASLHCQPEMTGFPTQKPEELLRRAIEASSNKGDLVVDCFAGSGTTCAVAEKLGRRWIGVDCGKLAVYTIQRRMLDLKASIGNRGRPLRPKPFALYNAGLYDFAKLRQLPWDAWRFFALTLFGCRDEPHTVGGLALDGTRKGASVLVFNHLEQPGRRIDDETVHEIHAAVGKRIGSRFFIIAPRGVFDFQQDYIDIEGVRYYALRIPYSVIRELHSRQFQGLEQPSDAAGVNAIVEAWGFDFIRPPIVKWSAGSTKRKGHSEREAFIAIKGFQSRAGLLAVDTEGGLDSFSMLMLDLDYDNDVFSFDVAFYASGLAEADWKAWFGAGDVGKQVMAVFIDVHGNEAREIIPRAKFRLPYMKARKTAGKKARKAK